MRGCDAVAVERFKTCDDGCVHVDSLSFFTALRANHSDGVTGAGKILKFLKHYLVFHRNKQFRIGTGTVDLILRNMEDIL
jgi:hypothetical protein